VGGGTSFRAKLLGRKLSGWATAAKTKPLRRICTLAEMIGGKRKEKDDKRLDCARRKRQSAFKTIWGIQKKEGQRWSGNRAVENAEGGRRKAAKFRESRD